MLAVVLPETVDLAGLITSCCAIFGATVAIAIGGFVAFLLTKKGAHWLNCALSSEEAKQRKERDDRFSAWLDVVDKD